MGRSPYQATILRLYIPTLGDQRSRTCSKRGLFPQPPRLSRLRLALHLGAGREHGKGSNSRARRQGSPATAVSGKLPWRVPRKRIPGAAFPMLPPGIPGTGPSRPNPGFSALDPRISPLAIRNPGIRLGISRGIPRIRFRQQQRASLAQTVGFARTKVTIDFLMVWSILTALSAGVHDTSKEGKIDYDLSGDQRGYYYRPWDRYFPSRVAPGPPLRR